MNSFSQRLFAYHSQNRYKHIAPSLSVEIQKFSKNLRKYHKVIFEMKKMKTDSILAELPTEMICNIASYLNFKEVINLGLRGTRVFNKTVSGFCFATKDLVVTKFELNMNNKLQFLRDYNFKNKAGNNLWYCLFKQEWRKSSMGFSEFENKHIIGEYSVNIDYGDLTSSWRNKRKTKQKELGESLQWFISKGPERRKGSISRSTKNRKLLEEKQIMGIFGEMMKKYAKKNNMEKWEMSFRIEYLLTVAEGNRYDGYIKYNNNDGIFLKQTELVDNFEFGHYAVTEKEATEAVVICNLSKEGYNHIKNVTLKNKSGLPNYSKIKNQIEEEKNEIFKNNKVLVNVKEEPVGVMNDIEDVLNEDYSNENLLMDLCIRNFYKGNFLKKNEKKRKKLKKNKELEDLN